MITAMRLRNFKAFEDTGIIRLKPLTVLAGPNSSGKSTILQSLLLLKQTLETQQPDIDLNLSGRFLGFSAFHELIHGRPHPRSSELGYHFEIHTDIPSDAARTYLPRIAVPEDAKRLPLDSEVHLSFRLKEDRRGIRRVMLNSFQMNTRIRDMPGPSLTMRLWKKDYRVKLTGLDLPDAYAGRRIRTVYTSHFLPVALLVEPEDSDSGGRASLRALALDPVFRNPLFELESELTERLRYLGPLRAEPERAYLHSGTPRTEIGTRGEYAAQMLWLDRNKLVKYVPTAGKDEGSVTLLTAVNDVFHRLGIVEPVEVTSAKSVVYQILLRLTGYTRRKTVTIADVGFGVSQLLPIVVMALRSPPRSLLMFEQPEIHLHPRVQANLADFFLALASSGKRVLVETHSDHFINRLRRRIAEDATDGLKDQVSILFVRPQHNGEGASLEPLEVDRYGVVVNWPSDFLPESADEAEAIVRAGLAKRRESADASVGP